MRGKYVHVCFLGYLYFWMFASVYRTGIVVDTLLMILSGQI